MKKRLFSAVLCFACLLLSVTLSACGGVEDPVKNEDAWRAMFELSNVTVRMTTTNASGYFVTATYKLDGNRFSTEITENGKTSARTEVYDTATNTVTAFFREDGGEWQKEEPRAMWTAWAEHTNKPLYVGYADEYPFSTFVAAGGYYEFNSASGDAVRVYAEEGRLTRVITFDLDGYTHEAVFTDYGTTSVMSPNG